MGSKAIRLITNISAMIIIVVSLVYMLINFSRLSMMRAIPYSLIPPFPPALFMALFIISLPFVLRDMVKKDIHSFSAYLLLMVSIVYLMELVSFIVPSQVDFTWSFALNSGFLPIFALVLIFTGMAVLAHKRHLKPNEKISPGDIFGAYLHPKGTDSLKSRLSVAFPVFYMVFIAFLLAFVNSVGRLSGVVSQSSMLGFWLVVLMDTIFVGILVRVYMDGGIFHATAFTGGIAGIIVFFTRSPDTFIPLRETLWLIPFLFVALLALFDTVREHRKRTSSEEIDRREMLTFR